MKAYSLRSIGDLPKPKAMRLYWAGKNSLQSMLNTLQVMFTFGRTSEEHTQGMHKSIN